MFQSLRKLSLKNQVFEKYLVFFADILTLTVTCNIKLMKAIKVNRVLFMYT